MRSRSTRLTGVCWLAVFFLVLPVITRGQTSSASFDEPTDFPNSASLGTPADPQPAQDALSESPDTCGLKHLGKCLKDVGQDQIGIWTSPFHAEPRDAEWLLPLAGATALAIHYDGQAQNDLGVDRSRTDATSAFSNAAFYGSLAGDAGLYLFGVTTHDDHLAETARLGGEAVADASIVVEGLKLVTNRQRPTEGNGQGDFWPNGTSSYEWDGSFPSEHAAAMFALARVISGEYPSRRVAFAAYLLAAAVSASRVTAREHFPSDVLVGGAVGYLVGSYVGYHRASDNSTSGVFFSPVVDQATRTYGLQVQLNGGGALCNVGRFIRRL